MSIEKDNKGGFWCTKFVEDGEGGHYRVYELMKKEDGWWWSRRWNDHYIEGAQCICAFELLVMTGYDFKDPEGEGRNRTY